MSRRRLFILGAGASYAAGLPDGGTLPAHLFGYVGGAPWEVVRNRPPDVYYAPLKRSLFEVLAELGDGGEQSRWALDDVFERFHDRLRRDPAGFAHAYTLLYEATAQLLYTRSCYAGTSEAYESFAAALRPDDVILTFNWDLCPELALHEAGRSLSRAPAAGVADGLPLLLKLHGSIDHLIVDADEAEAAFFERLGVPAPSAIPGREYELVRLLTYDLGHEIKLVGAPDFSGDEAAIVGGYDIGPLLLVHTLAEFPSFHLLAPGSAPVLYEWQYSLVQDALESVCPEIERIYVAGYSFPAYDERVFDLLRMTHEHAGRPPTTIVNPSANELPPELLSSLFGDCELRAAGFQEFDWRAA